MKKNLIILLTFIGLTGIFSGCEKDGTMVTMLADPIKPELMTIPDLTLKRTNGLNVIEFTGTLLDPGFKASATYLLEACVKGNNFKDPVTIFSGTQCTSMKMTVSALNGLLLKKFPGDQVTSADFRIRAVMVVDAGTGALGTSSKPLSYTSAVKNVNVTPYGLPRLDLIDSGITQKIESALGDGNYAGFVKLDAAKPFTLKDPDANITYGADGKSLKVNGTAFSVAASGWHKLEADTKAMTYTIKPYMVGIIGSATPNGWSAPDSKMNYNYASGLWELTLNLVAGHIKFRMNDSWNDGINLGIGDASHPENTLSNLWNDGGSKDIPISEAGNYTIKLNIGASVYSCTITKN